ncbi:MAG TPA: DNA gyrase subunit A [Pseudomonadota bacterium]|jgi:DNA gyrase subunit A|nr:DNA gyrase subunit A [Pseudomonadota bacterium]
MAHDKPTTTATPPAEPPTAVFVQQIHDEMRSSFMDYAMSVIIARALPDARDGLKPVHRRILYAMHEGNIVWNRPYVKCARVVGEVLGKYHPHGDASVYDALVRLAQDWNMRYPLVDGQGNFGSIEGDPPAAYRYTECRLQRVAASMLADLDKETVDFVPNFDDKEREPTVLPALLPNLLVNGAAGIAVGMATNIPPHNMGEVLDAALHLLKEPTATNADLMRLVPGPDFPTWGFIYGRAGIRQAYETGRGSLTLRARTEIEELKNGKSQIIVTEVPYQVNPNRVIERLAELVREKKIEGISDLRNESSREGMRLVIELKRDAVSQVVLNQLFQQTSLQVTFGVMMLAIVDGRPRILSLRDAIGQYLEHRRQVVLRRSLYMLRQARARREIVEGLGLAIDQIDRIIAIIRAAKDPAEAKEHLMAEPLTGLAEFLRRAGRPEDEIAARTKGGVLYFSEPQAKAILDMRLQRLTGLERDKLAEEYRDLTATIVDLEGILASEVRLREVIAGELSELRGQYTEPRRTEIIDDAGEIRLEELIAEEPMVVTLSREGYVRRVSLSEYRAQGRGGRGVQGASTKEEDLIHKLFVASTHDYVLMFTNTGRAYSKRVFDLPESQSRAGKGKAMVNFLELQPGERIVEMLPLPSFDAGKFVMLATAKGVVKKTELDAFSAIRSTGIIAVDLDEGDDLVGAAITDGQSDIALCTRDGYVVRFREEQVRAMGRTARGVRGVTLKSSTDRVVAMQVLSRDLGSDITLLTVCEKGFGKRTPASDYPQKNRGTQGVITIKTNDRNGKVVGVLTVVDSEDLMLVTDTGRVIRIRVRDIPTRGRNTQGVRLIRIDPASGERVVAVEALSDPGKDGSEPGEAEGEELAASPIEVLDDGEGEEEITDEAEADGGSDEPEAS